jgi:hypothetical protein
MITRPLKNEVAQLMSVGARSGCMLREAIES